MLTGNWLELHSNAEFARHTLYGQRLVQGSLVFSVLNAMIPLDAEVVFYRADRLRFAKPTFIGDHPLRNRRERPPPRVGPRHGVATSMLCGPSSPSICNSDNERAWT